MSDSSAMRFFIMPRRARTNSWRCFAMWYSAFSERSPMRHRFLEFGGKFVIQLVFEHVDFFLELLLYVFRHFLQTFVRGKPRTGAGYRLLIIARLCGIQARLCFSLTLLWRTTYNEM